MRLRLKAAGAVAAVVVVVLLKREELRHGTWSVVPFVVLISVSVYCKGLWMLVCLCIEVYGPFPPPSERLYAISTICEFRNGKKSVSRGTVPQNDGFQHRQGLMSGSVMLVSQRYMPGRSRDARRRSYWSIIFATLSG
jgi:hypothetical protein